MKKIGRFPLEVFSCDYEDKSSTAKLAYRQQYCKYVKGTCVKPRKSEPSVKVVICTLASSMGRKRTLYPVIICPQRFKEDTMFETLRQKYLSTWKNVKWIKEVNIGVGGNIDYVAVEVDEYDRIKDFLCVEIQAAGTTGTPYPYVKELLEIGHYSGVNHKYGINWANEFSKTMMQQAYKKGKIVESWHRKIVFVVQDLALQYLESACDCSKLVESDSELPVDFCMFNLEWTEFEWKLKFKDIKSTSIEGVNAMLGGAKIDSYPTEEEFIKNIIRKGLSDGDLVMNNKLKKEIL